MFKNSMDCYIESCICCINYSIPCSVSALVN
nr:MAG TPA: hypothetical protein [Caudoviricetes sp.]